jgi:hypothetical protein
MITNHAEFKRLLSTPGVKLETLALAGGVKGGRLYVGQVRPVVEANTTGVYLATPGGSVRGSFLGYDKASDWQFQADTATHKCGLSYRLLMPSEVNA